MSGPPVVLSGIGVAPGVAVGAAWIVRSRPAAGNRGQIAPAAVEAELHRAGTAWAAAQAELQTLAGTAAASAGPTGAAMLQAMAMFLDDPELWAAAAAEIRRRLPAAWAITQTFADFAHRLQTTGDPYLQARSADVVGLGERVLHHLEPGGRAAFEQPPAGSIVVAAELDPAAMLQLVRPAAGDGAPVIADVPPAGIAGVVTAMGSPTSHMAILARALNVPAVVGVAEIMANINPGDILALDGLTGRVIARPEAAELEAMGAAQPGRRGRAGSGPTPGDAAPAVTADGRRITLQANIALPMEVARAVQAGAEGIGLFRTEFLFMDRPNMPGVEEQAEAYRVILAGMPQHPVWIRTLDVGGDKPLPYVQMPAEQNPFLGIRGIRLYWQRPELFNIQIEALLRASTAGNLGIMLPVVSTLAELQRAKATIYRVRMQLEAAGVPVAARLPVGIMIETPAAALTADLFAPAVDFFSIGTNDLIQYTMAADRYDARLADLQQPTQPAVLRLIAATVKAGRAVGIPVGVCGEMAGDPRCTQILLGMGITELSMSVGSLPAVRAQVRALRLDAATRVAEKALGGGATGDTAKA